MILLLEEPPPVSPITLLLIAYSYDACIFNNDRILTFYLYLCNIISTLFIPVSANANKTVCAQNIQTEKGDANIEIAQIISVDKDEKS